MGKGYMYILECSDKSYYTGSTIDLERRLIEHQGSDPKTGASSPLDDLGANYTKKRRPVKLAYCEEFSSIEEAFYREKQVQGWGHKKKQALIEGKMDDLPILAKKTFHQSCYSR